MMKNAFSILVLDFQPQPIFGQVRGFSSAGVFSVFMGHKDVN